MAIDFNGEQIATDKQGYLLDFTQWQEGLAIEMAKYDAF